MNTKSYILIFLAALCVNATRCSYRPASGEENVNGGSKLKLTPNWSNDMRISYYYGGGMANEYTRYEIYTDSASYTIHEDQVTNVYKLKFSKSELDAIAKVFYDNNFVALTPKKHEVIYDAPSRSIMICKSTECCEKGNDATSSFSAEDGKKLHAIQEYTTGAVYKKFTEMGKEKIHIIFDPSLTKTKYDYKFEFAPTNEYYDSKRDGRLNEIDKEIPAGDYNLIVYTYRAIPNVGTKYGGNGNLLFSTKEFNTVTVTMAKDSSLVLTPSKK